MYFWNNIMPNDQATKKKWLIFLCQNVNMVPPNHPSLGIHFTEMLKSPLNNPQTKCCRLSAGWDSDSLSLGQTVLVLQESGWTEMPSHPAHAPLMVSGPRSTPGTGSSFSLNSASPLRNYLPPLPPDTGIKFGCNISRWLAFKIFF